MINTQLRSEAEIPNGSKLSHLPGIVNTKFLSFKANLTLEIKVKVTSFQTHPKYLNDH